MPGASGPQFVAAFLMGLCSSHLLEYETVLLLVAQSRKVWWELFTRWLLPCATWRSQSFDENSSSSLLGMDGGALHTLTRQEPTLSTCGCNHVVSVAESLESCMAYASEEITTYSY